MTIRQWFRRWRNRRVKSRGYISPTCGMVSKSDRCNDPSAPWNQPMTWDDFPEHSAQEMRLIRSGLKPEPGAFERSVFAMEVAAGEWQRPPEVVAAERKRQIYARFTNEMAKIGMPKHRRSFVEFVFHPMDE